MKITQSLKAIVTLLGVFIASLVQATAEAPLPGQAQITLHEWLVAASAALVLAGTVWVVPNYTTKTNEKGQAYWSPIGIILIILVVVLLVILLGGRL